MKVGDHVKILHTPYINPALQPGKTGRVSASEPDGSIEVVMDDGLPNGWENIEWCFDQSELELVQ